MDPIVIAKAAIAKRVAGCADKPWIIAGNLLIEAMQKQGDLREIAEWHERFEAEPPTGDISRALDGTTDFVYRLYKAIYHLGGEAWLRSLGPLATAEHVAACAAELSRQPETSPEAPRIPTVRITRPQAR